MADQEAVNAGMENGYVARSEEQQAKASPYVDMFHYFTARLSDLTDRQVRLVVNSVINEYPNQRHCGRREN